MQWQPAGPGGQAARRHGVWGGPACPRGTPLENARVRAEIERARQIAERELEIGRKIQTGFLPAALPVPPGWEIAAHFQPALQVSGDFYDVFEMAGGRCLAIVIADVCDHGVGSALFMALTRSLIRAFALQSAEPAGRGPGRPSQLVAERSRWTTVQQTNAYIADNHGEAGMFATLFLGILDPATGRLTYVNGGHEPPMFLRSGQPAAYLKATGLAVGAMPDAPFRAESVTFKPETAWFCTRTGSPMPTTARERISPSSGWSAWSSEKPARRPGPGGQRRRGPERACGEAVARRRHHPACDPPKAVRRYPAVTRKVGCGVDNQRLFRHNGS
ncbi:MAG: SpoIIE family protein phosphatase [Desulfomicrobium escambiense]|nr:SpoIIE family protein phosphatase [Desulfomicrobium escambiense]